MNFTDFKHLKGNLPFTDRMPAIFIGHGSPMNGIEDNSFSASWTQLDRSIMTPSLVSVAL